MINQESTKPCAMVVANEISTVQVVQGKAGIRISVWKAAAPITKGAVIRQFPQ